MHILYIHQHFSTPKGNAGTRSYEFAKRLVADGHRVTMLCGSFKNGNVGFDAKEEGCIKRGVVDGIEVIQIALSYSNNLKFYQRVWVFLAFALRAVVQVLKLDYDVIYATSTPLTVAIPALVAKVFRFKPYFFEVRDLWPNLPIALGVIKNPVIIFLLDRLERLVYRFSTNCIALSPGIQEGICEKTPKLIDKVPIIPNSCDTNLFKPAATGKQLKSVYPELFENGVSDSDLTAVFSGTHGLANGLQALIEVSKELKAKEISDIKLVMIGSGGEKESLVKQKSELELDNCIFMPPLPKERLVKILPHFDIGLQILKNIPEFYYGTSPNKFFDYIASGLPVLTNYPGWVADLISDNRCGFVVKADNPTDFVNELISVKEVKDSGRLSKLGNNSRKLAENEFSRDKLYLKFSKTIVSN